MKKKEIKRTKMEEYETVNVTFIINIHEFFFSCAVLQKVTIMCIQNKEL